jgi:GT2 family glycosyltransferase
MVSRAVLDEVGFFNETRYFPEDWEMFLRISLAGYEFGYLEEFLVVVEVRDDSNTTIGIQHILKQNAIEALRQISSLLSPEQMAMYNVDKIIRRMHHKLAIAYLANGQKDDFARAMLALYRRFPVRILIHMLVIAVRLAPSSVWVRSLTTLWRLNQKVLQSTSVELC